MTNEQLEKAKTNADNMALADKQGRKHGVVLIGGAYQVWVVNPKSKDYIYVTGGMDPVIVDAEEVTPDAEWDDLLS